MSSTNRGGKRSPADYYPTPGWCVHRLLEEVDLPGGHWLEPAGGEGAIIDAVSAVRDDVAWSAVEIRDECRPGLLARTGRGRVRIGDFVTQPGRKRFDVIITNPPFSMAEEFVRASLSRADHVVMLLRLNFLASAGRAELMRQHPPGVYVLPNRPSFDGKGTDSIEYAWFHWRGESREVGQVRVLSTTSAVERRPALAVAAS